MFPPIFALAAADAAAQAIFGISPRVFPFGSSPAKGTTQYGVPYAVWQSIGINPENYLDKAPDADFMPTQIDVYADTVTAARNGAQALRNLYQQHGHVTTMREWPQEPDTKLFRYQLDVDFWQYR